MLIYDIETKTADPKVPNPDKDTFRFIGAYSSENDKYYFYDENQKTEIQKLFNEHRVIVAFNNKHYDDPILRRFGINIKSLILDLREIIKKRSMLLGCKNQSMSLLNLSKFFSISEIKQDNFDYSVLQNDTFTIEQYNYIKEYTIQDVKTTKELFDYVANFFSPFKDYMNQYDIYSFKWLTASPAAYAYKVICHLANIKEEYSDNYETETFPGGFVALPIQADEHDDIIAYDFNSLYPFSMIQANLFGHKCNCCTDNEKWKGNDFFKIKGSYCMKKPNKISEILRTLYEKRLTYKKVKDRREYVIKIIINTIYGLLGNPVFKNVANYTSAADCTYLGRKMIKYVRERFDKLGYTVLYTDTDSVYIKDIYKDKDRLNMVKNSIMTDIKKHLPFPDELFDLGIDYEIDDIYFFKSGDKYLMKMYLFKEKGKDSLTMKGLPMIKSDGSKIGLNIFKKYMEPEIIKQRKARIFKHDYIKKIVETELEKDISIVARTFNVKNLDYYKNNSQLQAQISKQYGPGKHLLLCNHKYGVGKGHRYCTIDEFKQQGLNIHAIVLDKMWNELSFFIEDMPVYIKRTKSEIRKKRKKRPINRKLFDWTNIEVEE